MLAFLLNRLASLLLSLLAASIVIFLILEVVPGDPASFMLGLNATPESAAALREALGLDGPPLQRYLHWLLGFFHGDLGISYTYKVPVAELVADRIWLSLPLAIYALALSTLIAFPVGILAASRRGSATDVSVMGLTQLGVAIPNFWFAMLLVLLFAVTLHWLPAGGWGEWNNVVLPVIALALPNIAYCARLTRASLLETLSADYLSAARARGYSETRLLFAHALKPALLPVVAWLAPALINVVTGSVVVEQVFGIPGMGRYFVQGALNRDYTLVLGVVLVIGALIVAITTVVDALRGWMDPRLERS